MTTQPTPPPGYRIIPAKYLIEGNALPKDAKRAFIDKRQWNRSNHRGSALPYAERGMVKLGELFYCTSRYTPLPCFDAPEPSETPTPKPKGSIYVRTMKALQARVEKAESRIAALLALIEKEVPHDDECPQSFDSEYERANPCNCHLSRIPKS